MYADSGNATKEHDMTNAINFLAEHKTAIFLAAGGFGIFSLLSAALEAAKGL